MVSDVFADVCILIIVISESSVLRSVRRWKSKEYQWDQLSAWQCQRQDVGGSARGRRPTFSKNWN